MNKVNINNGVIFHSENRPQSHFNKTHLNNVSPIFIFCRPSLPTPLPFFTFPICFSLAPEMDLLEICFSNAYFLKMLFQFFCVDTIENTCKKVHFLEKLQVSSENEFETYV